MNLQALITLTLLTLLTLTLNNPNPAGAAPGLASRRLAQRLRQLPAHPRRTPTLALTLALILNPNP